MSDTLKPCPFCKSEASLDPSVLNSDHNESGDWFVGCYNQKCSFMPRAVFASKREAITNWNDR